MRALLASALLLLVGLESLALAGGPPPPDQSWWNRITASLDEAAAPYKIVPPTPVVVHWKPREIWSGQLEGEVVDMVGVDLGQDGKSELVALTSKELVVLSRKRGLFDIRMKAELPPKPSSIRPRDAIGSLSVEHTADSPVTLRARSSERALGGVYQLVDNKLKQIADFRGYPMCENSTIQASPGRNYFLSSRVSWQVKHGSNATASPKSGRNLADALYSLRCSHHLVDPQGRAVEYMSAVSTAGQLKVYCEGDGRHCQSQEKVLEEVGDAHLVTDVDNDGLPEVFHSSRSAPGEGDRLLVVGPGVGAIAPVYQRDFQGGIVAIAAGDFAGDGALEVVVAVRKKTSKRVTLWLLN